MNEAAREKQEIEKRIKEYIQASSRGLSKKEDQDFKELVIHNEETAKKVFRGSNHIGKAYILIYLNSQGRGADIAKEEAADWAGRMEFINSDVTEEQAFRSWLSGETDIMPKKMPSNKYIMGFTHRKDVELCYLSKVCTFTERLMVYGIKKGYVFIVRGPMREMMRELGAPYTHSFLEHTVRTYQLSEEDIMQMYSAIYAGVGKTKAEKEFYRSYICAWLDQDKDRYLAAIEKISKDTRKKIFTVLKRENLYTI